MQQRLACNYALSSGLARSSVLEAEARPAAAASAGAPAEQPPMVGTAHPGPSPENPLPSRHVSDPGSAASSRADAAKGLGLGTASSEPDGRTGPARGLGLGASPAGSAAGGSSARLSDNTEAGEGAAASNPEQSPSTEEEAAAAAAAAAAAYAEAARVAAERDARARWQAMQEEEADLLVRSACRCCLAVGPNLSGLCKWHMVQEHNAMFTLEVICCSVYYFDRVLHLARSYLRAYCLKSLPKTNEIMARAFRPRRWSCRWRRRTGRPARAARRRRWRGARARSTWLRWCRAPCWA